MNLFSSPDARFWQARLRPGEQLVWIGRPRLTVTLGWPVLWAVGPAIGFAMLHLFASFSEPSAPGLREVFTNWQEHTIPLTMMAGIAYCAVYLFRFGLLFPSQQLYAITDRRLMVWRPALSPGLIEEEIDSQLKLESPKRPRNSVHFSSEILRKRSAGTFSVGPNGTTQRQVGFINPRDGEGMMQALEKVMSGGRVR